MNFSYQENQISQRKFEEFSVEDRQRITEIVNLFVKRVLGKSADVSDYHQKHSGKRGHWIEQQMGVAANCQNAPDLMGFEMKDGTKSKTSGGDWRADRYIYEEEAYGICQNDFLMIFGKRNEAKGGRYSWAGTPCPKIGSFNSFGQRLEVDEELNIKAVYSYSQD